MVQIDISPVVKAAVDKAISEHKEVFDAILQEAQRQAWDDGYLACREGWQRFSNPYREVKPDATN